MRTATALKPRKRLAVVVGATAVACVGALVVLVGGLTAPEEARQSVSSASPEGSQPTPTQEDPTPAPEGVAPGEVILTTAVEQLEVFAAPGGELEMTLSQWSAQAFAPLTLMATDSARVDNQEWFEVLLPSKPNGSVAWVKASDVTVSSTDIAIDVYLEDRELDLRRAGIVIATYPIAVGSEQTPTPLGTFYITDPLDFTSNPSGVYGAWALGISGFSEVLDEFYGGPPQVAIHGTNEPALIGQAVSNGCIRMSNDNVTALAGQVGLGTPVIIHASRDASAS